MTKSLGYNLWRGNNIISDVDGIESHAFINNINYDIASDISEFENKTAKSKTKILDYRSPKDIKYDYKVDNIFFTEAF